MTNLKIAMIVVALLAASIVVLRSGYRYVKSSRVPPVPRGTTVHRDLAYVTNGHARQKLDLYLSKGAGRPPLMILIHGGGFREGDKREENVAQWLTDGYAVASVNYRYSSDAIFPAQVEDCKAAVRWLRANAKKYGYDSERFGVRGSSAGGYLVTMLGTTGATTKFDVGENLDVSSRVQAVADRYGPIDFLRIDEQMTPGGERQDAPGSPLWDLLGGRLQDNREKAEIANPINYITVDCPPFIIVHGDRDPLVPHFQSELLAAAFAKAGVPVTLFTVKGGGHGGFDDPKAEAVVREFFARHLKPAGT
jgi:acetyl esterase/lipase